MYYPDYLIHYNKNHSAKNGQFTSGDGDGDGISNDHAHRSKKAGGGKSASSTQKKKGMSGRGIKATGYAALGASFVMDAVTQSLASAAHNNDSNAYAVGAVLAGVADVALTSVGFANIIRGNARMKKGL